MAWVGDSWGGVERTQGWSQDAWVWVLSSHPAIWFGETAEVTYLLWIWVSSSVERELHFGVVAVPQGNEYERGVMAAKIQLLVYFPLV